MKRRAKADPNAPKLPCDGFLLVKLPGRRTLTQLPFTVESFTDVLHAVAVMHPSAMMIGGEVWDRGGSR